MHLFWAEIIRDYVFLFRWPLCNQAAFVCDSFSRLLIILWRIFFPSFLFLCFSCAVVMLTLLAYLHSAAPIIISILTDCISFDTDQLSTINWNTKILKIGDWYIVLYCLFLIYFHLSSTYTRHVNGNGVSRNKMTPCNRRLLREGKHFRFGFGW